MRDAIRLYEELTFNAHPALQTQFYDGWVLRFANGYSNRANSVNFLYPSALDANEKIIECEKRYFTQGLPSVFKITESADPLVDNALERRGYEIVTPTYVMEMDMRDKVFSSQECVFTSHADGPWLEAFFSFSQYTNETHKETARQMMEIVKNPAVYGRIVKDGITVACGSAVIERGYAALLNIVVDGPHRGKGYGSGICQSLLSAARKHGAHTAYLQVEQTNDKALSLYTKLGYKTIYPYYYRVKERNMSET